MIASPDYRARDGRARSQDLKTWARLKPGLRLQPSVYRNDIVDCDSTNEAAAGQRSRFPEGGART
jgi:hypothetical protein